MTDYLGSYHRVAEALGLYHQVCLWHVWRWVGWALGAQRLLQLWTELPAAGAVGRPATALDRLRQIIQHLHHGWATYRLTLELEEVPRCNNGTEQVIGRFKSRSKQVRGHKAWSGVERTLLLSSELRA